jgi:sorbitol-specific phosphotransferase system component IIBC
MLYNKQSPSSLNHSRAVYEDGSRYTLSRETKKKIFKNTSVSANTVVENVEDLTGGMVHQLKEKRKNSVACSVAIDCSKCW